MLTAFRTALANRNPRSLPYLRCSSCGYVGPSSSAVYLLVPGEDSNRLLPPEYTCAGCGQRAPLDTDSLLPSDMWLPCRRRWICRYVFAAPATASTVTCPRCATTQPGPGARPAGG